jgi:hypothetical protein
MAWSKGIRLSGVHCINNSISEIILSLLRFSKSFAFSWKKEFC